MATTTPFKERAYQIILKGILTGQYHPGELLNRRSVAAALGMSTAPVHEAMLRLERDGLMEALSRVGTRVKNVSWPDIQGHLVVREALECQVARLICGAPVKTNINRLISLADAVDELDPLAPETAEREVIFHNELAKLSDCPALFSEYQRMMRIGWFYRINMLMILLPDVPSNVHRAHLETLSDADPQTAETAVRKHIWHGKPKFLTRRPLNLQRTT